MFSYLRRSKLCNFMMLGLPPSGSLRTASPLDLRTLTLQNTLIQFFRLHLCQQQDSTEAIIHWKVLAEKGLKRLFRAAFCSLWTGKEGTDDVGNAQLPSNKLPKWWACHSLFAEITGQQRRQRLVSSHSPLQIEDYTEGLLWLAIHSACQGSLSSMEHTRSISIIEHI